jgi:putative transposase
VIASFIDDHRGEYGFEPICEVADRPVDRPTTGTGIWKSTLRIARCARRDEALCREIRAIWETNRLVYGARKVWRVFRNQRTTIPAPVAGGRSIW